MTLNRRRLAIGLFASTISTSALAARPKIAVLTQAEQEIVDRAGVYLQGLAEAKGRFIQTDARGNVSRGEIFLKRPGRARFAYDPPSRLLVVADGSNVTIANSQLKTFDRYPLIATPLSIFLARQIRLDRGILISEVRQTPDGFSITARDGRKQAEGQIVLSFADRPLALNGWTVTDAQGQSTHIALVDMARVSGLPASLFQLIDPRQKSPGRGRM